MTDIDWSKAPKGATHYGPRQQGFKECWYKHDQQRGWFYMLADTQYGWLTIHSVTGVHLIPVPVPWTGDGLPPVGAVCEYMNGSGHWHQVRITGHGELGICFRAIGRESENYVHRDCAFRPIPTPEQIAEEEREKARDEVLNAMSASGSLEGETEEQWQQRLKVVGEMLDMGYRKQEAV